MHTNCDCLGVHDNIVTYRWTIQDTGIGMSDEFIQHIFEPFAQERIDARSVYNGTGLGMSIVKSLIGKMGGTIEVTSKQGEGTQFVITLSFEISEEEPKRKLADSTVSIEDTDMGELHLLIVEDNDLNAEIAQTCQKFRSLP